MSDTKDATLTPEVRRLHNGMAEVWANPRGLGALTVVNHTSVGLRFMVTGAIFFLIGGLLAMLIRTQLAFPDNDFMSHETYNQVFTMHGTVMMFLFAIPILEGLAIYMIPKMIGARDLVCPRLSAFGYFCYLFGGIILVSSLLFEMAPASGWFMYTPLSSGDYAPGRGSDFWLLGITFVEISALSAGVELVVSILRTRTEGMPLHKMPLFAWYILAMALMIVVGFPPLILGSILLELERATGMPFFDVAGGGDPVLWAHLFWLFGHPEVYIIFLPGAGIVSTLIPVFARRPIVGYGWVVAAIVIMGFVSFGLWVHHMFTLGIPQLALAFFSAASMLVAIPTGIQIFVWLSTLWLGRPVMSLPMLWIIGFLVIFVLGGLTGVMLALVPFNWQVHDTHFVVAHMHYVLVGGMLFPLIAGLYYWLPLVSGRMPSARLGKWSFWLIFLGFNLTFLIMHWTGLLGMRRRVFTYDTAMGWDIYNLISSVGGFMMSAGVALLILDVALHFRFGKKAPQNPWNADGLEWTMPKPPTPYNFVSLPRLDTRHPLWDDPELPRTITEGRHGLNTIDHGRRETWGSDALTGKLREVVHLPTNSWWPFFAALALAMVCVCLLVRIYPLAAVATLVAVVLLLRWSWENGAHPKAAPDPTVSPGQPPLHSRTMNGPGVWTMSVSHLANGSLFLSLLFGWFYLWTVAPEWQMPETSPLSPSLLVGAGISLTLGSAWLAKLVRRLRRDNDAGLGGGMYLAGGLGALQAMLLAAVIWQAELAPTETAHDATLLVALLYVLIHALLGGLLCLLQGLRVGYGFVGAHAPLEPVVVLRFWYYHLVVYWVLFVAIWVMPTILGGGV
ncbi:MAG: cytochrome c oxidase subunit I [Halomonas sp.]|uniref:cytochrome-c oxidase n=1 Tax=Billgrantia tianxiuensis TaxID=2497861 RepID=A0A6I6SKN5_9GAMM|nr:MULTISPECIES: cytochrome c oxidase subunit I [Halomonas]MCE8033465.1 cytochrome c oxidase subunit I [Halomonas sp. MCCC 1A11057]MDX5432714.1 cytochrome c oxidase subunit I [Halomonas sp.]MDX5502439.1 cytochrome c oxidase subunit I [Halomonas sp.]QHC49176.1 cytochrome c oxidase subunit I [Halomonas tianxiuensis]